MTAQGGRPPEAAAAEPAPPSFLRRHGAKTVASIAIAAMFAWVLARAKLPLLPTGEELRAVSLPWVLAHVGLFTVMHSVRALRLRHLLRPLSPEISSRRVLAASWIGFTAILLLPLRAGEIVRPLLVRDGKKITLSSALGTVGAERVIDGLVVTGVLAGALIFVPRLSPLPDHIGELKIPVAAIPAAGFLALFVFVGAFVAMAIFYFARDLATKLVRATLGRVSAKLAERLASIVGGLADGLHFLADARHGGLFVLETLVYWGLNAVGMWVLGLGCGLDMHIGHACAVMGVLAVGILVPAGPGLFGAFQAATYGALAMYFVPSVVTGKGAVYVFLLYGVQFAWHLVAAAASVVIDPGVLRRGAEG
jgi:uncharacterized protein (TIRG00374 family)